MLEAILPQIDEGKLAQVAIGTQPKVSNLKIIDSENKSGDDSSDSDNFQDQAEKEL